MTLDEKLRVQYESVAGIDRQMAKTAFDDFVSTYKLEIIGLKSIYVSAESTSTKPLLKISPQRGSEIGAVLLREEYADPNEKSPEIVFSGAMGRNIYFFSEKWMYAVEIGKK